MCSAASGEAIVLNLATLDLEQTRLEGNLVALRPWAPSDSGEMLAALDESRAEFFPWVRFALDLHSQDDCAGYIVRNRVEWLLGTRYSFAVEDCAGRRCVGGLDLFTRSENRRVYSIGYWLRTSAVGHGYMRDAVRVATGTALGALRAERLEIMCDARNRRSAAIPETLGYTYEGSLRNWTRAPDGTLAAMSVYARIPSDPPIPST